VPTLFLIDEDITAVVGRFLGDFHNVRWVTNEFGSGTEDRDLVAWARARGAVLVTADRKLALSLRESGKARCLFLKDLRTAELDRVITLHDVIVREHAELQDRFWMDVARTSYLVRR
jgi:hypothetical protein